MPILLSIDNELHPTTAAHPGGLYEPVDIGKPLAIELKTFFPGKDLQEWGFSRRTRFAEIMFSSQIRSGPSNKPAPELVNFMVRKYGLKSREAIRSLGGDRYGDMMLYYTKAYTGNKIGMTFKGTELDKIPKRFWDGMDGAIKEVGKMRLFAPYIPYLAGIGLAARAVKMMTRAVMRNDRLQMSRVDMEYKSLDSFILQSGRYLIWSNYGPKWGTIKSKYRLSGPGDVVPNCLVDKVTGEAYIDSPYIIFCIDAREKPGYEDFEIGAASAQLLAEWGDVSGSKAFFETVQGLAAQVNDANQLSSISDELQNLKAASSDEEKLDSSKKIKAYSNLLSESNGELLKELLSGYLPDS